MKATEFCYWLQGLFELGNPASLSHLQVAKIKQHLDMVFIHDIDPSYPADQQAKLNEAHFTNESLDDDEPKQTPTQFQRPTKMRC